MSSLPLLRGSVLSSPGSWEQCEIPQQILVGCLAVLLTHPSVSILFIPG